MTLKSTPAGTPHSYTTPADTAVHLDPHDRDLERTAPLTVGQLGGGRTILVDEAWQLIAPDPDALRTLLARAECSS